MILMIPINVPVFFSTLAAALFDDGIYESVVHHLLAFAFEP